jgi:hypothetical protein
MKRKLQIWLLGILGAILAVVVVYSLTGSSSLAVAPASDTKFVAIAVENPELHLGRIEKLRKLEYHSGGRNIFSAELPPPPKPPAPKPMIGPPPPPPVIPPAPLVVPFKFYGFTADPKTGRRRAFFTNGDDVFIASEGEVVQGRFRVLRIGNTTSDVEETASGRRATLPMEQQPGGEAPQG